MPIKLVQKPKEGECASMRCKGAPFIHEKNKFGLCENHLTQWVHEGFPELTAGAPKRSGVTSTPHGDVIEKDALETEVENARTEAQQALALARVYPIQSQADMDKAGAIMAALKHKRQALDDRRKEITAPLNKALKSANQLFKPVIEYYESAEKALKATVSAFVLAQKAEQDRALAAVAAGSEAPDTLAVAHGVENVQNPPTVSTSETWAVESIDASQVPAAYWILDTARIEREVRAKGADHGIPGVVAKKEIRVINRG